MYNHKIVAAVIPAYNEAEAIGAVVKGLKQLTNNDGSMLLDDVVVCDNNSSDNTAEIARKAGARVVFEARAGYGVACQAALAALSSPDIVIFVDGDCSVVPDEVPTLLHELKCSDLVIGSRVLGACEPGALTVPQQFGNWLASCLIRILWGEPVTDLGPFRAICYEALQRLDMRDMAFGWTVEMQVKAAQMTMVVSEVPVSCRARVGVSKISGTVKGVLGAACGILGTIFKLWWRQHRRVLSGQSTSHY